LLDLTGYRAVPDQRETLATARCDVRSGAFQQAGVELRTGEPAIEGRPARIEHPIPAPLPIDRLGGFRPEFLRLVKRAAIGVGIARRHRTQLMNFAFPPRGAGDTLPPACQSEVTHHIATMLNYQFIDDYYRTDRPMPTGDPTVFGFPCRFPAAPSVRPESGAQDIDQKRTFRCSASREEFLP